MIELTTGALLLVLAGASPADSLQKAEAALADFRPEDAVKLLEQAKSEGPYTHSEHALLYERLGIALAYLERSDAAVTAFKTMLAIDPSRAISYTLSPKVTFVFEQARKKAAERASPAIDLSWSRDLNVNQAIEVEVEVLADPESFLKQAKVYYRLKGSPKFSNQSLKLPRSAERFRVIELPALAAGSGQGAVAELYLVALDDRGNEVLKYGSAKRPREISLRYEAPQAWYSQWWFWAAAAGVVAAGAGTAVFAATREPSPTVDGNFRVLP